MFSYLITAIAVVLCLLGALAIFGNFGALLEAQRNGKSTSFAPGIVAVFWCLGIYCIPEQYPFQAIGMPWRCWILACGYCLFR